MKKISLSLFSRFLPFLLLIPLAQAQSSDFSEVKINGRDFKLYPFLYKECPDIPSPFISGEKRTFVVCLTDKGKFTIMPVTIENGTAFDCEGHNFRNKGRQLDVNSDDFPTLSKTGLHSEKELSRVTSITGKSVTEKTKIGRPGAYSDAGFLGPNEDIISVLLKDNQTVTALGLPHPRLSSPLFHLFNILSATKNIPGRMPVFTKVLYQGNWVTIEFKRAKGWHNSIFNDEIKGFWQMEISQKLTPKENVLLLKKYGKITEKELSGLKQNLSYIHTGEMVPYYIQRYGFYEGFTSYRADPVAISFIFGLKSLEKIENIFGQNLHRVLKNTSTTH